MCSRRSTARPSLVEIDPAQVPGRRAHRAPRREHMSRAPRGIDAAARVRRVPRRRAGPGGRRLGRAAPDDDPAAAGGHRRARLRSGPSDGSTRPPRLARSPCSPSPPIAPSREMGRGFVGPERAHAWRSIRPPIGSISRWRTWAGTLSCGSWTRASRRVPFSGSALPRITGQPSEQLSPHEVVCRLEAPGQAACQQWCHMRVTGSRSGS